MLAISLAFGLVLFLLLVLIYTTSNIQSQLEDVLKSVGSGEDDKQE